MPRKATICRNCQVRHLKCVRDAGSKKCSRCKQSGTACEQDSALRVRNVVSVAQKHSEGSQKRRRLDYAEDQVWVPVPPSLDFQEHHGPSHTIVAVIPTRESPQQQHKPAETSLLSHATRSSPRTQDERQSSRTHSVSSALTPVSQFTPETQADWAPLYTPASSWPFETGHEAHLFLHYVQRLSTWLDALDSNRHFGTDVPRRASYVPVIMNAILASASRHIAFVSKNRDTESAKYHDRCLQILIPVLDNPVDVLEENLFAAIVILRQYEELDGEYFNPVKHSHADPSVEADERCHLFGSTRMVSSVAHSVTSTSLREAANWVALRQEIHISLTTRQPVSIILDAYRDSSYFHSDTEDAWANRMVFLFARVLNYSFRSSVDAPEESWSQLEEEVEAWNITKPQHLSAIWTEVSTDPRYLVFPHVMMLGSSQVNGMQHYCLAKILLAAYDPRLLTLGFDAQKLRKDSEEIVLQNLRMVIGLAISNPQTESSFMHASHMLSTCGSYFSDKEEQKAAIEFLYEIERRGVWRTSAIVMRLQEQWK